MTGQRHSFGAPVLARIIRDKDQPPVAASSARLRECGRRLTHIMPRTHNNLFEQIASFDNLWAAYLDARRGKRPYGTRRLARLALPRAQASCIARPERLSGAPVPP